MGKKAKAKKEDDLDVEMGPVGDRARASSSDIGNKAGWCDSIFENEIDPATCLALELAPGETVVKESPAARHA